MNWKQRIKNSLIKEKKSNTLRSRTAIENNLGRFLLYNNRRYLNFSSNDYLGLSRHPGVIRAWQMGAEYYGVGSCSSGHVIGYTKLHREFEEEIANWLGYQRALLFNSGFAANQSIVNTLMSKNDRIIADKLSHASILEAANLSQAQLRRFRHNDPHSLLYLLQKPCVGHSLVITEGIFSMDGDAAPLDILHSIIRKNNSWLMVDDAHGFGVVGDLGKGSCFNNQIIPELLVVTFGKSLGVGGAVLLCNEEVANYMLQYSQHMIYSTNMSPAQVSALLASLKIIRGMEGEERRQKLAKHINQFRDGIASLNMYQSESNCAIQPLIIGTNSRALALAERLRQRNIWAIAIRPPAVPKNTARIRITLSATHEAADIAMLLETLYDLSSK